LQVKKIQEITFESMLQYLNAAISCFPDKRTGQNTKFSMNNVGMGAFSLFFTQNPSFLSFQTIMQKKKGKNNAQSLFGISEIPSDNQIRSLLDIVDPSLLFPVFSNIFKALTDSGCMEPFRSFEGNLLCALDGTQYFSSQKIHCRNCNHKKHKNGTITYFHTAITPVIVAPGKNKVISLEPEFITPQDGHTKQDCENAAAKRWIRQYASIYKKNGLTILGDDLYCKHSICSLIIEQGLDFILTCKPGSHKKLYQLIEEFDKVHEIQEVVEKRWTGNDHEIDTYRFLNNVPVRDGEDAIEVNWCELVTAQIDGTILYKNAFATNFKISKINVKLLVTDGRARWKVENENNNVLKTKGYHLEHNFGHGDKHLSSIFLTFNLLSFLFHTVLDMMDEKYRLIREDLPTRETFFNDLRALTRYMYFDSWDSMMTFMFNGLELSFPNTS